MNLDCDFLELGFPSCNNITRICLREMWGRACQDPKVASAYGLGPAGMRSWIEFDTGYTFYRLFQQFSESFFPEGLSDAGQDALALATLCIYSDIENLPGVDQGIMRAANTIKTQATAYLYEDAPFPCDSTYAKETAFMVYIMSLNKISVLRMAEARVKSGVLLEVLGKISGKLESLPDQGSAISRTIRREILALGKSLRNRASYAYKMDKAA